MNQSCLIFDLDGTLIDSRADIAAAVNFTRTSFGFPEIPLATVVSYVGDGVGKLLERAFPGPDVPSMAELRPVMMRAYRENAVVRTTLYPGVADNLKRLFNAGFPLAVVSNKPTEVCSLIFDRFGLSGYFSKVIGGGSAFPLKPAPDALLYLLRDLSCVPAESWVLGDNHTDMFAAVNARMNGAFAAYGFGTISNAPCACRVQSFGEFAFRFL